ncbi:M6 metalloprotease [Karstenula rhodostoma CBS 690.94]|uniref:M6 metalloprotease n=1 Tax=Karstenula rhodostoma CBS 690.94 TaxID=1392251 RepID=A0A9P4PLN9_9PLEO|nr:M6 metalloprotease [Karstenula rhodostoma CBS 690.94]
MRAFMIFVDFADQPAGTDTTDGLYDFFFPNASTWYETSSYDKLVIDAKADTSQFHRMPLNASDYAWNRGITYEQHESYIQDALGAYANVTGEGPPPVDVLYVVATRNAPSITYSPTFMGDVTMRDGAFVAKKAVTVGYDAYAKWGFKLINHETGHVMCLADLYPASGAVGLYVGDFSIMGNINAAYPEYFAWDKWRLGWLDDAQVECLEYEKSSTSFHTIFPLEKQGAEIKSVVLKRNESQAMVLEVRSNAGVDDKGAEPGVVVYTVDTAVETLQGPIRLLYNGALDLGSELAVIDWDLTLSVVGKEDDAYTVRIATAAGDVNTSSVHRTLRQEDGLLLSS